MSLSLRKCFRNLCVLLIVSISFPFSNANAQIDYSEDFAACFAAPCEGWSWDSPSGLITPISTSGYSPCEDGNASATSNLNGAVSLATFMSTDSLGVSSGEPVMLSFDYKVLNNITGTAAADNSVTFSVEWSNVATGGTWNQVDQFNNVSGTTCETREVPHFIVPLGEKIYVRINLQRSTGNVWVVLDNINLFQPPPAVPGNTDCACNNDSSLNMDDGTFSSYLTIVYPGTDSMPPGLDYTLLTSTGLNNTSGGSADGLTFVHCVGGGCPTGITKGHYYLEVQVQNGGAFTTSVDGPDMDMTPDANLDLSSMCTISYPALPTVPFAAMNCLDLGINTFTWDVDAVVNRVNSPNGIEYPDGITQTGPREITIDDDLYFEADNQPDGLDFYFINTDAGTGCTVSSFINTEIFNAVSAGLNDVTLDCRRFRQNDSIFLTVMLDSTNSGGGEFLVNGNIIPEGKFGVSQDA